MTAMSKVMLKNRYEILKELGHGGMGAVFKARDIVLDIDVAVKELFDISHPSVEQFEKEAKILAKLSHPNLPRVTDFFNENRKMYLVMDFIEGNDLEEILRTSADFIEENKVIEWMIQVLNTLDYVHSNGIIHRDIKPSNLKLTPYGKIMVVDFGIAKIGVNSMTSMGASGFTPYIAPPEQYTGTKRTGTYSDIYSVGATMYYLLTKTLPSEAVIRMMGSEMRKPSHINPDLSGEVEKIILKAMSIQPYDRYSTAKEMKYMLEPLLSRGNIQPERVITFKRDIRKR